MFTEPAMYGTDQLWKTINTLKGLASICSQQMDNFSLFFKKKPLLFRSGCSNASEQDVNTTYHQRLKQEDI